MAIIVALVRLKKFEVFQDLPDEQISWFIAHSETKLTPSGEHLFEPDQAMNYLHVILSGKLRILIKQTPKFHANSHWKISTSSPWIQDLNFCVILNSRQIGLRTVCEAKGKGHIKY